MNLDKEQLKGYVESILLSVLSKKDMYGYEIFKIIRSISEDIFEIKEGTLYVVLKRLEMKELIKSYWSDNDSKGGRRKYHSITDKGLEYLKLKKFEWQNFKYIIDKFMEVESNE